MLKENIHTADNLFFDAKGYSMGPFVKDKDKIIVKRIGAGDLKIGDIILYQDAIIKQNVCHRLIKKSILNGSLVLVARGDASGYEGELIPEESFIGVVTGVVRNGKIVNLRTKPQILLNWLIAKFYVYFNPIITRLRQTRKRHRDFLKFAVFLWPYWRVGLAVVLLNALLVPLGLIVPYLTKLMIDGAYQNRDFNLFMLLIGAGGAVFLVTAIIEGICNYLENKIDLKVIFDLNKRVFRHLQNLSINFFQDKSTGEHIYKINFDLENLAYLITRAPAQFLLLSGRLLLTLAMVFYLNWQLALVCLAAFPVLYLQPCYFIARRKAIFQKQVESSQSIFVKLEEIFSHMHLVKAFGKEGFESESLFKKLLSRLELSLQEVRLGILSAVSGDGVRKLILGILGLCGGYQIIKGQMSLGSLTAVMIYFTQLVNLQSSFGGLFEQMAFQFVSCDRVQEILNTRPQITEKDNAVSVKLSGADIEFRDVSFGYRAGSSVINNLNFILKKDAFIALVGPSGCGKTTLLSLLIRLYDVHSGRILIKGLDIKDIKLDCLKGQIGIALQEPFLFNDTIGNNIRYGKEEATFVEIEHAAKVAQIHQFIASLPQGYDTNIGEMASKISEGQKQRIAIARAVIKKPAILILDEAMASLDSETEEKIIQNLRNEFPSSAVIVVTHRLSTVKKMDLVYFLKAKDEMKIAPHQELLEQDQDYRQLFASQIEAEKSYKL